jgi:hypothetical protein
MNGKNNMLAFSLVIEIPIAFIGDEFRLPHQVTS